VSKDWEMVVGSAKVAHSSAKGTFPMKKLALAIMSAAIAILGFGVVAEAQYGARDGVTVSPSTVPASGNVTLTINGCTPGEVLTVTLEGNVVGTATCNAGATLGSFVTAGLLSQAGSGSATITFQAPAAAGTYNGTVVGNLDYNQAFQIVVIAASTPPGGLPATGSGGIDSTLAVALGLFAVGLGLFGVAQFRRRQSATLA
jgi:hypothetical protein